MSDQPVWGIDLTGSSLRAVKLVVDGGRPLLEAWEVVDFANEVTDPHGPPRFEMIHRVLRRFAASHTMDDCIVAMTVRSETLFLQTTTVPQHPGVDIAALLKVEVGEQVPGGLADRHWDHRVERVESNGDVVATFFALPKSVVDHAIHAAHSASVPIDRVEPSALAVLNLAASEGQLAEGTLVIDVDYASLTTVIAHEGRWLVRTLPMGGCDSVELLKGAGLKPAAAYGLALTRQSKSADAMALFARVNDTVTLAIVDEITRMIRCVPAVALKRVVLRRSHPTVPPLAAALTETLKIPVEEPVGFKSIDVNPDVVTAGLQDFHGGLARAVGAALPALNKAAMSPRLAPQSIPRPETRTPVGWLLAGLIMVAGVVAVLHDRTTAASASELGSAAIGQVVRDLGDDTLDAVMAKFSNRPEDALSARFTPRPNAVSAITALDAILGALANPPGGRPSGDQAPLLFGFDIGVAPGLKPGRGRVVLALVAVEAESTLDASLDRVAESFKGKGGISGLTPVESWTSGAVSDKPGAGGDATNLRVRFRCRRYDLTMESAP